MISVIATLKVRPGKEEEFERITKELVAKVTANEPGCLLYALHRGTEPQTYVFLERYADEAATETHRGSAHFKELGAKMGPCLDGRPQIQRLTQIV